MQTNSIEKVTEQDLITVTQLLGREPRGLEDIAVRDKHGVPVVIRVASLVAGKPFPTLLWLVDKRLNYAIDQVEARGLIAEFQERVDGSVDLQEQMHNDHQRHIVLRESYMSEALKEKVESMGFADVLSSRGIGGIADFQRIRCLHTYYAAHLVCPNAVGAMLDDHWREAGIQFSHLSI